MFKSIMFTHDDLDGAGCRILYEVLMMKEHGLETKGTVWTVVNCAIPDLDQAVKDRLHDGSITTDTKVTFADICPNDLTLHDLKDKGIKFEIYDHHVSNTWANESFPEEAHVVVADKDGILESGTSLFCNANVELYTDLFIVSFSQCVRFYDTYLWKSYNLKEPKWMQTLFLMMGMDRFCNLYVAKCIAGTGLLFDKVTLGFIDARLEAEQKAIDDFIANDNVYSFTIEPEGYKCAMVIGGRGTNISELGNQYLTAHPEYDCMCFYLVDHCGVSFRTVKDDVNLSTLCQRLGGGGHPKAAGASLDEEKMKHLYDYIAGVINS